MNQPKMIWDLPPGGTLGLRARYIFCSKFGLLSPKHMFVFLPSLGS